MFSPTAAAVCLKPSCKSDSSSPTACKADSLGNVEARLFTRLSLALLACATPYTAYAQTKTPATTQSTAQASSQALPSMRTGLWEHLVQMQSQSGDLERAMATIRQELASMPAAQRQHIDALLAATGMQMMPSSGMQNAFRSCLSRADLERHAIPTPASECKQTQLERNGRVVRMGFVCTGAVNANGYSEISVPNDTSYAGTAVIDTVFQGKQERMTTQQAGRWLSDDCGSVKPAPRK